MPKLIIPFVVVILLLVLLPDNSWSSNKYLTIEIFGLEAEEKQIVLANLSIKNAEHEKTLNKDAILSFYQLAPKEITTTLEALGFYHPKVSSELFSTADGFIAKYYIEPGPFILIRTVTIKVLGEGQNNLVLKTLVEHPPLKAGERLKHNIYEIFKQNLLGKALQLGYLDAIFNVNEIRLDPTRNQADILLELDTGIQFKFGKVNFPSPPYPPDYLKRYIPFSEGSPYTTEQLLSLQKALIDTDLFAKVRIDPELNETKNFLVPLQVRLKPKPHNKYTASIGFGTDTGARGTLGWERKRVAYPGHRININGRVSKRRNQLSAQYTIPGKHPTTDKFAFGHQLTEDKPPDHTYNLTNKTSVTHMQKRGRLERILAINNLSAVYRTLPTDPKEHTHFLLPNMGYVWNNIKKRTLLQHGTWFSFTLLGGLKSVLSSANIIQGQGSIKWILPFGDLTRLILRSNIGATATSNFSKLPRNLRFFTGGDHTVRGFGYESLGPRITDKNGNEIVVGGRYLFVGSIEFERKVYKNVGVAIFMDTGNAMNQWKTQLATAAGFGFRYETPLGPLRLDIARPTMRGKHKPRVHLTFGMNL